MITLQPRKSIYYQYHHLNILFLESQCSDRYFYPYKKDIESNAIIIMIDIAKNGIMSFLKKELFLISKYNVKDLLIYVIGNNSNLESEKNNPLQYLINLCKEYKSVYYECSSVNDFNVSEIMNIILRDIINKKILTEERISIHEKKPTSNNVLLFVKKREKEKCIIY